MFDCLGDCNRFLFATWCSSFEHLLPLYFLYFLSLYLLNVCYFYFFIFYSCAHLSIYVHVKKIIANMDKMHLFFSILLSCNAPIIAITFMVRCFFFHVMIQGVLHCNGIFYDSHCDKNQNIFRSGHGVSHSVAYTKLA